MKGMVPELQLEQRGLELSRDFFHSLGQPVLEEVFPETYARMAIGLVGEGSECFGFDDLISTDHDYEPAFCIWLADEDYEKIGKDVQEVYEALASEVCQEYNLHLPQNAYRHGVMKIGDFYKRFLRTAIVPTEPMAWLHLPEEYLATATNGEVFYDGLGEFSRIRQQLLAYYPEDVRRKKIAARAIAMAHAGQCNFVRMMRRHDTVAASFALHEFMKNTCSMVYLLNKKYAPYYKWLWRGMENLQSLSQIKDDLLELSRCQLDIRNWPGRHEVYEELNQNDRAFQIVELIAAQIIKELQRQGLSNSQDDYLEGHAYAVMSSIADKDIRSLPIMLG